MHANAPTWPRWLQVDDWHDLAGLQHGFCGRSGGVSRGCFSALNLSFRVGDEPDAVRENWRRVQASLGPGLRFVHLHQVHGDTVVVAEEITIHEPDADAVVTAATGHGLGILTADCVPLLMVDPQTRAIAAVHAGWRGTAAGIAARAVRDLQQRYGTEPGALRVALGPAVDACCYEVSHDVADRLEAGGARGTDALQRHPHDNPRVDLRRVNYHQLHAIGVRHITRIGPCTRCAHVEFFSHRQATWSAAGSTGRQLSFIGWRTPPGA